MKLYSFNWINLSNALTAIDLDNSMILKPTSPLLLKIADENNFINADIRLMVFGQETNSWYEGVNGYDIDDLMNEYNRFFGDGSNIKWRGQFKNGLNKFNKLLKDRNQTKNIRYIWNNIVKIGKSSGKGFPPEYIYRVEREHFSVIQDEIQIINPNYILFLTGPNYDKIIFDNFGELNFEPIAPYTIKQMAKFQIGNITAIRTYHPNFLFRNNINEYFNTILNEIKI